MTDPTLIFCPTCQGPLSPDDARKRITNGACVGCKVEPPDVGPGEILYCSRTGKELEPQDFRTGRAIRVYRRCVSLDAVREERIRQKETGEFGCDSCGARLTALDFLSGEARVVDKVVLCPRCRRKKPDPAGNGCAAIGGTPGGASGRKKKSVPSESTSAALQAAARARASCDQPPTQPIDAVGTESSFPAAVVAAQPPGSAEGPGSASPPTTNEIVGSGDQLMIGGVGVAGMVKSAMRGPFPQSDSAVSAPQAAPAHAPPHAHAHAHAHHQPAQPESVMHDLPEPDVVHEPRMVQPRAARRHGLAERGSNGAHAHAHPASAGRGTWHAPDGGVTIELATSRDLRWATGAMVLMVLLLCGLLLVVFLNYQAADPVLIARLQDMSERLDRMQGEMAALRIRSDSQQRDLQRYTQNGAPISPNPGNRGIIPPDVSGPTSNGSGTIGGGDPPQGNTPNPDVNASPGNQPPGNGATQLPPSNPLEGDPTTANTPPPTDDPTLLALKSPDSTRRMEALLDVNRNYDRRAIPWVLDMALTDADSYVRALAIRVLGAFRVKEAGEALQELVSRPATGTPPIVTDAARQALRDIGGN